MHIRRTILPASLTFCATFLTGWLLSVYVPFPPVKNLPTVNAQFDGERAMQYLDSLTHQFKGRIAGSAQDFAAADYVAGKFRSYGLRVETQDFREAGVMGGFTKWGWYKGQNVIGVLPGQERGTVVLTAHRDCVPEAPEGAYDNGSGTAAMMELARVLAAGGPYRYTYVFVALDGEEIGLAGSRVLMNNRPAVLEDIRLMVNLDMVGFKEKHQLGVTHTQYLSPEARALVASRFSLPEYMLLQLPMGRGTDALLYVWRGLPTLDIREIMPKSTKSANHTAGDTFDQVSADSIQQTGRAVEQLIRQGDAMGAFTPTRGPAASFDTRVLPRWRYLLGGICVFDVFALPMLFRLSSFAFAGWPAKTMAILTLLTGILTALSALWTGGIRFVALPVICTIAFLVVQTLALRRVKDPDPGFGRLLLAAAPPLLFAGTWFLTGLWPLGLWMAVPAYLAAVLVTWRSGWGWRILDVALVFPSLLLTWFVALAAWILAPVHMFPPVKLPFVAALYIVAALIGIWGIFGRRPARR